MAALAANKTVRITPIGEEGAQLYGAVGFDVIYKGAMLGKTGKYVRPLVAGDEFMGFADSFVDNGAGSSGDEDVKAIQRGKAFGVAVTGATADVVGAPVYAANDNDLTMTPGSNSPVGRLAAFESATDCVVYFEAAVLRGIT